MRQGQLVSTVLARGFTLTIATRLSGSDMIQNDMRRFHLEELPAFCRCIFYQISSALSLLNSQNTALSVLQFADIHNV